MSNRRLKVEQLHLDDLLSQMSVPSEFSEQQRRSPSIQIKHTFFVVHYRIQFLHVSWVPTGVIWCHDGNAGARYDEQYVATDAADRFWLNLYKDHPRIPKGDPNVLFALGQRYPDQYDDLVGVWALEGPADRLDGDPLNLIDAAESGAAIRVQADDERYYSLAWWAAGQPNVWWPSSDSESPDGSI